MNEKKTESSGDLKLEIRFVMTKIPAQIVSKLSIRNFLDVVSLVSTYSRSSDHSMSIQYCGSKFLVICFQKMYKLKLKQQRVT